MRGGGESGSEGISRDPLVLSGQGSVPGSVHDGAMRNLGVDMATRSRVANQASVAIPDSVASQAPPPDAGEMVDVLGLLDAL
jgi:hypothetical protein